MMSSRTTRKITKHAFGAAVLLGAVIVAACSSDKNAADPVTTLTGDALRDPNNCIPCHADQFKEWSGSMHAYASEDPVFIAMNKRMLRETNNANPTFCVSCHAPVALKLGLTKDGSNLAELPTAVRGVTCYFCHQVDKVDGANNNPLHLGDDGVMRGAIHDPAKSMPHKGEYSTLHDREVPDSANLCGACHDVVTPHGAHIERTFEEWKNSLYSKPGQLACGKCHMDGREGRAAQNDPALPTRRIHDHSMPAVDTALTPFFGAAEQKVAVQRLLDSTILTKLCVKQTPLGFTADVTLDNAFVGHAFPSGAAQDRRVWVELFAYDKNGTEIFKSGAVQDKEAASDHAGPLGADPNFWLLRDKIFSTDNREVHMFWEAARYESVSLPPAVTSNPLDPTFIHSVTRTFSIPAPPDLVKMRVRLRPLDFDVLDDLVKSGDLAQSVVDQVPTYDLASGTKEWTTAIGFATCVQ